MPGFVTVHGANGLAQGVGDYRVFMLDWKTAADRRGSLRASYGMGGRAYFNAVDTPGPHFGLVSVLPDGNLWFHMNHRNCSLCYDLIEKHPLLHSFSIRESVIISIFFGNLLHTYLILLISFFSAVAALG
jgi:hypothetical protein